MEALHGTIRDEISHESAGIGTDDSHVGQAPSANAVNSVTVVFVGPLNAEEIDVRLDPCLIQKERSFTRADLYVDRACTSENPEKIDFPIQILRL